MKYLNIVYVIFGLIATVYGIVGLVSKPLSKWWFIAIIAIGIYFFYRAYVLTRDKKAVAEAKARAEALRLEDEKKAAEQVKAALEEDRKAEELK